MRAGRSIVAIAVCVGGCGLLADCGEYGDATTPPDDASTTDSSAPPTDAPVTATDAADAADAGDAAAVGCAARTTKLCDDFDKGIASFWELIDNGAVADSTESISPPRSLLVSLAPSGSQFESVVLAKTLPAAKRIRVEATMRVDTNGGAAYASFMKIALVPPPPGFTAYYIALSSGSTIYSVQEYTQLSDGGVVNAGPTFDAPMDKWQRIAIELDLENSSASALVDGMLATRRTIQTGPATGTSEVRIGLPYMDTAASAWKVRMDDVTIDYE